MGDSVRNELTVYQFPDGAQVGAAVAAQRGSTSARAALTSLPAPARPLPRPALQRGVSARSPRPAMRFHREGRRGQGCGRAAARRLAHASRPRGRGREEAPAGVGGCRGARRRGRPRALCGTRRGARPVQAAGRREQRALWRHGALLTAAAIPQVGGRAHVHPSDAAHSARSAQLRLQVGMRAMAALVKSLDLVSDDGELGRYTLSQGQLDAFMRLDAPAVQALSLLPGPRDPNRFCSLAGVLDHCVTQRMVRTAGQSGVGQRGERRRLRGPPHRAWRVTGHASAAPLVAAASDRPGQYSLAPRHGGAVCAGHDAARRAPRRGAQGAGPAPHSAPTRPSPAPAARRRAFQTSTA